jgi:hypothetical protein
MQLYVKVQIKLCLIISTGKTSKAGTKTVLFVYRCHPVVIYEQQEGSKDRLSQLKFYQFYYLLHVSAYVNSHHQANRHNFVS